MVIYFASIVRGERQRSKLVFVRVFTNYYLLTLLPLSTLFLIKHPGRTKLKCMDVNGCTFTFPRSEIEKFLTPKVYEGFMKLCQDEDIKKVCVALGFVIVER